MGWEREALSAVALSGGVCHLVFVGLFVRPYAVLASRGQDWSPVQLSLLLSDLVCVGPGLLWALDRGWGLPFSPEPALVAALLSSRLLTLACCLDRLHGLCCPAAYLAHNRLTRAAFINTTAYALGLLFVLSQPFGPPSLSSHSQRNSSSAVTSLPVNRLFVGLVSGLDGLCFALGIYLVHHIGVARRRRSAVLPGAVALWGPATVTVLVEAGLAGLASLTYGVTFIAQRSPALALAAFGVSLLQLLASAYVPLAASPDYRAAFAEGWPWAHPQSVPGRTAAILASTNFVFVLSAIVACAVWVRFPQ